MKQNYSKPECSRVAAVPERGFAASVNLDPDNPWTDNPWEKEL